MPTLTKRTLIAGAGALTATAALAPAPVAAPRVTLATPLGSLTLELALDRAPISAGNFLRYVDEKRLDGADFYRADKVGPDATAGLIQGGLQTGTALAANSGSGGGTFFNNFQSNGG